MIPFKKTKRTFITYLEKTEMDALLNASDKQTEQGKRDYRLLLFLYDTGDRSDDAAQLIIGNPNMPHAKKVIYLRSLSEVRETN